MFVVLAATAGREKERKTLEACFTPHPGPELFNCQIIRRLDRCVSISLLSFVVYA